MLSRIAEDAPEVDIYPLVAEGASVDEGTVVAEVEGRSSHRACR